MADTSIPTPTPTHPRSSRTRHPTLFSATEHTTETTPEEMIMGLVDNGSTPDQFSDPEMRRDIEREWKRRYGGDVLALLKGLPVATIERKIREAGLGLVASRSSPATERGILTEAMIEFFRLDWKRAQEVRTAIAQSFL